MSLELRNGKVVFSFYLGKGSYRTLETEFRYNTKNWVSVAAARSGLIGRVMCSSFNISVLWLLTTRVIVVSVQS